MYDKETKITTEIVAKLQPQIRAVLDADHRAAEERGLLYGAHQRLEQGKQDLRAAKDAVEQAEAKDDQDLTRELLRGGANLGDPDPSEATLGAQRRCDRLGKHIGLLEDGIASQEAVVEKAEAACVSARVDLVAAARRIVVERLLPRIEDLAPELRTFALLNVVGHRLMNHRFVTSRDRNVYSELGDELSSLGIGIHYNESKFRIFPGDLVAPVDYVDPIKSNHSPAADALLEVLLASGKKSNTKLEAV